jgi:gliding motility-associated peptidyl-prolyl isomerase
MRYLVFILSLLLTVSCSKKQARKPISHSEGSFMKESAERNKKLIALEEKAIDSVIKSNPSIKYLASKKGYWYTYVSKNETDTLTPKRGDIAFFDYEVQDIKGNVIYTKEDLKPQTYVVDKENIMMGLRDGIKIMHKNESVRFLFTSNMAYGYHGDNKDITTNESLICTVTLNDFKPQNTAKPKIATAISKTEQLVPKKTETKKELVNPHTESQIKPEQ